MSTRYPPEGLYMTRDEAAHALGVSTRCLDAYAKRPGMAPAFFRWGKRTWYAAKDVAAFKARGAACAKTAVKNADRR